MGHLLTDPHPTDRVGADRPADRVGADRPADRVGADRPADRVGSSRIRELLDLVDRPDVLSLAGGLPDVSLLEADRVGAATEAALAAAGPLGTTALQYGPTAGLGELREVVAARLGLASTSGIVCTTGSQQALDLLARALCAPGDVVVVEDPAYLGAVQAFRAAGARLVGVPGDGCGMDVDRLDDLVRSGLRPVAVYAVPDHHNPTGSVMTPGRRLRLVEVAERAGAVLIEDAAYRELHWGPPTNGLFRPEHGASGGSVVHVGSASKVLAPGLRVGWLAGPADVVDRVTRLKQATDLHTATLTQLVVARLLTDGRQAGHLHRVRSTYRVRSRALADALTGRLGDRIRVDVPDGGMFLWLRAADGTDTDELFGDVLARGVAFVPGSAFSLDDHPTTTARLSFASLGEGALEEAASRLAAAWPDVGRRAGRRRRRTPARPA